MPIRKQADSEQGDTTRYAVMCASMRCGRIGKLDGEEKNVASWANLKIKGNEDLAGGCPDDKPAN